jgi:hypothetical protein
MHSLGSLGSPPARERPELLSAPARELLTRLDAQSLAKPIEP